MDHLQIPSIKQVRNLWPRKNQARPSMLLGIPIPPLQEASSHSRNLTQFIRATKHDYDAHFLGHICLGDLNHTHAFRYFTTLPLLSNFSTCQTSWMIMVVFLDQVPQKRRDKAILDLRDQVRRSSSQIAHMKELMREFWR